MMCGARAGIGLQLAADLLDDPLHLLDVGVVGDADRDLVDHPVARIVGDLVQRAERHGVQVAAMMAQLDRAQREALDGAARAAALDVLADAERIVEQEEHARDDVLDQGLRAEADRDADHAGAGDQRPDLDAERGERHQHRHHRQHREQHVAGDRQQRAHPRPAVHAPPACVRRGALGVSQLAVDPGAQRHARADRPPAGSPRRAGAAQHRATGRSPAIELTSTSQIQARSSAAPMIQSARRPRSSSTAGERRHGLGGVGARGAQDVGDGRYA